MKTAQDYLAEKLQEAIEREKRCDLQSNYWQNKYFDLLRKLGKTKEDVVDEIISAMKSNYGLFEEDLTKSNEKNKNPKM